MTAKNRAQPSKLFDAYHTPTQLVRAGFDMLCGLHGEWLETVESFVEPGCGPGSFCWGANLYCRNLKGKPVGVDIFPVKERRTDFKLVEKNFKSWNPKERFDLIASNFPFTWATEFLRKSATLLSDTGMGLALLRIGVLAGIERYTMWQEDVNLKEVWVCVRRPGFQGKDGGTDASEYAFFLFDGKPPESRKAEPIIRWLWWDK